MANEIPITITVPCTEGKSSGMCPTKSGLPCVREDSEARRDEVIPIGGPGAVPSRGWCLYGNSRVQSLRWNGSRCIVPTANRRPTCMSITTGNWSQLRKNHRRDAYASGFRSRGFNLLNRTLSKPLMSSIAVPTTFTRLSGSSIHSTGTSKIR